MVAHGRMKEKEARAKFRQVSHQYCSVRPFKAKTACTKIKLRHRLQRKDEVQIAWSKRRGG